MNETFEISRPLNSEGSINAIFSLDSAVGVTLCGSLGSPMTPRSGPAVVRANLSARQAEAAGLLTSGTYGHTGSTLLESAVLSDSLANRLRARTRSLGSTLYNLIWKARATPQGRLIFALRASARRISANDCTGWPTPVAQPASGTPERFLERKRESIARGHSMGVCLSDIAMVAQLTGWPTPQASDGNGGKGPRIGVSMTGRMPDGSKASMGLSATAKWGLTGWPTPRAEDAESTGMSATRIAEGRTPDNLNSASYLAGWPTPQSHDAAKRGNTNSDHHHFPHDLPNMAEWCDQAARLTASGEMLTGSDAEMASGGQLNPVLPCWLQGFPEEWGNYAPTETRSALRKRQNSSRRT